MAARFGDELAERFLGVAIIVEQAAIGLRLLDRVEILALDILEQGDFERLGVAEIADDRRNFVQARLLRRAPAALAGDDLEAMAVRTHDDRLDHAARGDRLRQFGQRFLVEGSARLAGMRLDACRRGSDAPRRAGLSRAGVSRWMSPSREERPRPRPEGRRRGISSLMPPPPAWAGGRSARGRDLYRPASQGSDDRRSGPARHGSAPRKAARCAE